MTDPLSVAAGVAGLVALAGSTSKIFYQFFHSIHEAPNTARELASGLFSLNIVLSQVQEVLLNPDFVQQSEDHEAKALDESLTRCARLLKSIEKKVVRSGLTHEGTIRKAWASVRWSFSEDELIECRRQAEEEKASLGIVLNAFTARMTVGLLGEVKQLQALAEEQGEMLRKQNRMIEDVHVILQFREDATQPTQPSKSGRIEYSAFTASETYSGNSLANLLGPSNSTLNLRMGDLRENTISAVWEPDPATRVPLRRVHSRLSLEQPDIHNREQLRSAFGIKSPPHEQLPSSTALVQMHYLSKIAYTITTSRRLTSHSQLSRMLRSYISAMDFTGNMDLMPLLPLWGTIRLVLETSSRMVGIDLIVEDLRDIADTLPMIELAAKELDDRATWTPLATGIYSAVSEYVQFATSFYQKKRARIIAATGTDQRRELREKFDVAYKRFRRSYDIISRSQLLRQQREATEFQKQLMIETHQRLDSLQHDTSLRKVDSEGITGLENRDALPSQS